MEPSLQPRTPTSRTTAVLTYTLSGTDAASFDIVRASRLSCTTKAKLNYETKNSYDRITVKATDSNGLSASIDVTITVTNVDEAPEIAGDDMCRRTSGRTAVICEIERGSGPPTLKERTVYWSLADDFWYPGVTSEDIADARSSS